jgi:hypothetical protein
VSLVPLFTSECGALDNANAAQTLSDLPAGAVYRLEQDLGASLAANTNPAGNLLVHGRQPHQFDHAQRRSSDASWISIRRANQRCLGRMLNSGGTVTIGRVVAPLPRASIRAVLSRHQSLSPRAVAFAHRRYTRIV